MAPIILPLMSSPFTPVSVPAAPVVPAHSAVTVRREAVTLPTYEPLAADKNPMFLEKRVYQGSTGKVYPLPFIDRIADTPRDVSWDAIHIENEFLYVMILPRIGGRIHVARDKTNGYDFIYRQDVIKPALVGLAGPWISGGIEFNWPQHHRPSTFMPTDVHIEHHDDGAITVWLGEHEPMNRMKGMHGVCLYPGRALIELKARVYNRTPHPQTFLWWANVATRVHEGYQSFFPTDVSYVADHAKRAMSTFPLAAGHYYGVPYGERARTGVPAAETPTQYPPHLETPASPSSASAHSSFPRYRADDLSWYANIPVPTSYMCMGTADDFFGGYDHRARAGLVHVANHHIAPGKKQWTWGNHAFGYAWDRNLTDADAHGEHAPYIELMAGVYTDNQPDFSHLQPGETRSWSQYWYPIREIGPAQQAGIEAAASLHVEKTTARLGVAVTAAHAALVVTLAAKGKTIARWTAAAAPDAPFTAQARLPRGAVAAALTLRVTTADGRELLAYTPRPPSVAPVPPAATEPAAPAAIASADELFITGLHLDQYRHATRSPALYWREALRRDPGDSRCHLALGRWHLQRGEFTLAEPHLRASIARLTLRNPNPADGEAHYQLGLVLRHLDRPADAYAALYKATWNHAWQAPAHHALAELDAARRDWPAALDHLDRTLRVGTDNLKARALKILVLRALGRADDAAALLRATRALDPLDAWTCHLDGDDLAAFPTATRLDVAHDYARAGFLTEALALLAAAARQHPDAGTAPVLHYTSAWLHVRAGDLPAARRARADARAAAPDYCFPSRLEDIHVLESARAADSSDARAAYYLGNLLYDRRRHAEALSFWEKSARLDPSFPTVWRNLGIACFNVAHRPAKARAAYEKAFAANPADARVLYERDQLWKRLGLAPAKRLRELEKHAALVATRDDLSVEFCALLNQTGSPERALAVVGTRKFQPWEGGEGQALGQHVRTHQLLARRALAAGDTAEAVRLLVAALSAPLNLGEANHLLANQSDLRLALGDALAAAGRRADALPQWRAAAEFQGDFQGMSVRAYSEVTYFSALALRRLGKKAAADKLLRALLAYARALAKTEAKIDYFATSLPTMLLFDDDLQARQLTTALFLEAQARLGLGQKARAVALLRTVLQRDPAHAIAADLAGSASL
jgi:tetratricopeptide (TPR) repeat protein